jgi:uncharacterized protein YdcH (DUF465 family)
MVKSWIDGWTFRPHFNLEVKLPTGPLVKFQAVRRGNSTRGDMPRMERNTLEEIKAHLMQTNARYRDLLNQHHEYKRLVDDLEKKNVLTPEEEIEEHRLKKLKLHIKDEMEMIVSEYNLQHTAG